MTARASDATAVERLAAAGLPAAGIREWLQAEPGETTDFPADRRKFSNYWQKSSRLVGQLPAKPRRNEGEQAVVAGVDELALESRVRFLRRHGDAVYDALTVRRSRFVRLEDLVARAAGVVPGLAPTEQEIAAEDGVLQRDKSGLEIDQGLFVSAVLGSERSGRHLCHAMLLPRPEAHDLLAKFRTDGVVERPGASIERRGKAALLTYRNPRFLNAEDDTTLAGMETCVDLALLDHSVQIAVLRGGVVENPKY